VDGSPQSFDFPVSLLPLKTSPWAPPLDRGIAEDGQGRFPPTTAMSTAATQWLVLPITQSKRGM